MNEFNKIVASVLNISLSDIENIHLSQVKDQSFLYVKIKKNIFSCPFCGSSHFLSHGSFKRKIIVPANALNHITIFLYVKRFKCPHCNHSFSQSLHLSPTYHSISYASILQVMELLKNPNFTFKNVAELVNISESSVIRIFDHHCHISRAKLPEVLCIDEVYTKNSTYDSKFSCVLYDFFHHTIVDVTPSRQKSYLHSYFQKIPLNERNSVHYICMDMYLPYKQLAHIYFKKAIICVDSFHVIKHLNDDLHKIRIRIMKRFPTDSIEYYLLKHWKNLLFDRQINLDNKGKYNKKLRRIINFRQLLDMTLAIDHELETAFYLKEKYTIFNASSSFDEAQSKLDDLINEFIHADIKEFYEFITLLTNWKQEIINSFIFYKGKRINNSVAESLNSRISLLLFNTKGIRNDERRRKRIIYAINKSNFSIQ